PTVGVTIIVTVEVAAPFRVPILHRTVLPVAAPQVPGDAVAEINVEPLVLNVSRKLTPEVMSPLLVMVYVNVTWFPTPVGFGDAATAKFRLTVGPSLVTKASLPPLSAS